MFEFKYMVDEKRNSFNRKFASFYQSKQTFYMRLQYFLMFKAMIGDHNTSNASGF